MTEESSPPAEQGYSKGRNPNSLAALEATKFRKGQSGNPKGRKKKKMQFLDALKLV